MTSRTRAGVALLATLAALGAGLAWYVSGLTAITEPPADGADPERWWACTQQATATVPNPPECLRGTP